MTTQDTPIITTTLDPVAAIALLQALPWVKAYSGKPGCGCGCRGTYTAKTSEITGRVGAAVRALRTDPESVERLVLDSGPDGSLLLAFETGKRYHWFYTRA